MVLCGGCQLYFIPIWIDSCIKSLLLSICSNNNRGTLPIEAHMWQWGNGGAKSWAVWLWSCVGVPQQAFALEITMAGETALGITISIILLIPLQSYL